MKPRSPDMLADVIDFHKHFELEGSTKPCILDASTLSYRLRFLRQETQEYEDHSCEGLDELSRIPGSRDEANLVHHLSASLDSLVDLIYVALGTVYLSGMSDQFNLAWRRVHHANMQKKRDFEARGSDSTLKFKIVKPPGWEAPKLDDLVEDHAHKNT